MSDLDAMVREGHRRFRLPNWNPTAFIEPEVLDDGRIGPWTTLHDCGTERSILTLYADQQSGWEPIPKVAQPVEQPTDEPA